MFGDLNIDYILHLCILKEILSKLNNQILAFVRNETTFIAQCIPRITEGGGETTFTFSRKYAHEQMQMSRFLQRLNGRDSQRIKYRDTLAMAVHCSEKVSANKVSAKKISYN